MGAAGVGPGLNPGQDHELEDWTQTRTTGAETTPLNMDESRVWAHVVILNRRLSENHDFYEGCKSDSNEKV